MNCRFVRELSKGDVQHNLHALRYNLAISMDHKYEFLPYNSAYLQKDNTENDENPPVDEIRDKTLTNEEWNS